MNKRLGPVCVSAAVALMVGCNDPAEPRPVTGPAPLSAGTTPTAAPPPPAARCGAPDARGAQVIVDVSQSMRGFTAAGSVNLEKLHTAIDAALGDANTATPLQRCTLGDELDCQTPVTRPQFNNGSLYSAANCRLDRAIRVPPVLDPRNPPRDELDHHRVTVVLTDGMQSMSGAAGAGDDPVAACNAGADPNCVRLLLRGRIVQGYGVWISQLMLPFQGTYYAEQGMDRETYEGIKAHVSEASQRLPYSRAPFSGTGQRQARRAPVETLTVGRNYRIDTRTGRAAYEYRGWRPMVLWIITCDQALGDRLAVRVLHQLTAQGLVEDNDRRYFSQRVAPMSGQQQQFGAMVRAQLVAGRVDVGRMARTPTGVVQRVTCDTAGRATLVFPMVPGQRAYENPPFVRESIGLGFEGRILARDALSSPVAVQGGLARTLRCDRLAAGVVRETMTMGSSLGLGDIPADAWWREFNARNSYSMPERVFGLQPLVEGLLEAGVQRSFQWDRFTIEIERL